MYRAEAGCIFATQHLITPSLKDFVMQLNESIIVRLLSQAKEKKISFQNPEMSDEILHLSFLRDQGLITGAYISPEEKSTVYNYQLTKRGEEFLKNFSARKAS